MHGDKSTEKYRENKEDSDNEEEEKVDEDNDDLIDDDVTEDVKPIIIKAERLSPCEQDVNMSEDGNGSKALAGLHLTFNLEAGSLLPLAIK